MKVSITELGVYVPSDRQRAWTRKFWQGLVKTLANWGFKWILDMSRWTFKAELRLCGIQLHEQYTSEEEKFIFEMLNYVLISTISSSLVVLNIQYKKFQIVEDCKFFNDFSLETRLDVKRWWKRWTSLNTNALIFIPMFNFLYNFVWLCFIAFAESHVARFYLLIIIYV